jgi:hypothetical protein
MVTPPHVAHAGSKKKMNIIQQPNKGDNVPQRPSNITQLSKNNNMKNII